MRKVEAARPAEAHRLLSSLPSAQGSYSYGSVFDGGCSKRKHIGFCVFY
jgi:hypothetical protein